MIISRRPLKLAVFSMALALSTVAVSATSVGNAQASPLSCQNIDDNLALFGETIRMQLNARVAGLELKISNLKRLVSHGVNSITAGGGNCEVTVVAQVTLERKLRRDAHGTITMRAHVDADAVTEPLTKKTILDLRFTKIHVTDVSLSHTLEIGESFYQWIANKILSNTSVRLDLGPL
jgi:hypothetical protein